jgi:hypothetical protein
MNNKPYRLSDIIKFILILAAVLAIWGGAWWWVNNNIAAPIPTADAKKDAARLLEIATTAALRGQFGDQFGAVNALFSGFAFAGIIFTILLQRSDLVETRHAIAHERFDTTFFELLKFHMSITENVKTLGGTGKEAFVSFHEVLKGKDPEFYTYSSLSKLSRDDVRRIIDTKIVSREEYQNLTDADVNNIKTSLESGVRALQNYLDNDEAMHERKIKDAYIQAAENTIDDFAHYFRYLYNVIKFVDESKQIGFREKCSYSKFIRSQLSEAELIVLFYNSIGEIKLPGREGLELGYPKMSALLVKYDILQNMNPRSIIHPIHKTIFFKNAPKG